MDFNMDTYFGNICGSTNNEQLNITEQNSRMNYLNAWSKSNISERMISFTLIA